MAIWEITTPPHIQPPITKTVKVESKKDEVYYLKWKEQGYEIREK